MVIGDLYSHVVCKPQIQQWSATIKQIWTQILHFITPTWNKTARSLKRLFFIPVGLGVRFESSRHWRAGLTWPDHLNHVFWKFLRPYLIERTRYSAGQCTRSKASDNSRLTIQIGRFAVESLCYRRHEGPRCFAVIALWSLCVVACLDCAHMSHATQLQLFTSSYSARRGWAWMHNCIRTGVGCYTTSHTCPMLRDCICPYARI